MLFAGSSTGVPPVVAVNGSHRGQPVDIGTSVVIECSVVGGIPSPELAWTAIPSLAQIGRRGAAITATLSPILRRECFTCAGSSLSGQDTDQLCVDVRCEYMHDCVVLCAC